MTSSRSILVTGATGQQGGAALRHLSGKGFELRALTRKPEGSVARALAAQGVRLVEGNLDDAASLTHALTGVWGVFSVQNPFEGGVEKEEEQGKRLAVLAKAAGVQHFVYSSVASAHRSTGIPHFENKWRIEQTVRSLAFPSHVIMRPVFFMENLLSPWFLSGDTIYTAMQPTTVLQMIAVEDVGRYHARAFTDAERLNRHEIDLAADALTIPEAASALGRGLGRSISFVPVPIEVVRQKSDDVAIMLQWFDRVGFDVNIPALEREFGNTSTRLGQWAAEHRDR